MPDKVACPKCGEANYATDRQCLSCGAALTPAAAPAATPVRVVPGAALPARALAGDDRSWWRRQVDDVIEYQLGALIGLAVPVLGLALMALVLVGASAGWSAGFSSAVSILIFMGVAAFFFVWYTRDPDSIWPLVLAMFFSGLLWWIAIALCAFAGAAIEKKLQKE